MRLTFLSVFTAKFRPIAEIAFQAATGKFFAIMAKARREEKTTALHAAPDILRQTRGATPGPLCAMRHHRVVSQPQDRHSIPSTPLATHAFVLDRNGAGAFSY
jgi:hypothetical protein